MSYNLTVGQDIWYSNVILKNNQNPILHKTVISKIGRTYFELEGLRSRFFINNLTHDPGAYSVYIKVYLNPKEWDLEIEKNKLNQYLKLFFSKLGVLPLSIEKMREIKNIILSENELHKEN